MSDLERAPVTPAQLAAIVAAIVPNPMTWTPQPEAGPNARPAGGVVAGVPVCAYHRDVLGGLRTAHGSPEGHQRRVAQVAGQCMDCLREQGDLDEEAGS